MRPFETLESLSTPEGRRLTLHRRDGDFFLQLDGEELMSSRMHGSEIALAELARDAVGRIEPPRVLIGGLGLGYTLRAALDAFGENAVVVVAEIFPEVVDWHRRHLIGLGPTLEDPRVEIQARDVRELLVGGRGRGFHAILLDVDNGPSAYCLRSNRDLYERRGLLRIARSLESGGVLAVWSATPDPAFVARLRRCGFAARAETVRGRGRKGPRHTIFLARRR